MLLLHHNVRGTYCTFYFTRALIANYFTKQKDLVYNHFEEIQYHFMVPASQIWKISYQQT